MGASAADPLGLAQVLPWLIGLLTAYYALRVTTALLLLAGSRWRPELRRTAVAAAPAVLRPWLRRAVAGGLLGVALSGVPALASTTDCPPPAGIPALDRAASCAVPAAPAPIADSGTETEKGSAGAAAAADAKPATYTVQRGDSLWRIAADLLGPDADDTAIARAWPSIWNANSTSIGTDPSLIRPGTTLTIPADLRTGASR